MHSARWGVSAVTFLLVSCSCSVAAYSQTASFLSLEAGSIRLASLPPAPKPCAADSDSASITRGAHSEATIREPVPCDRLPEKVLSLVPCNPALRTVAGCAGSADPVRGDLSTMGKQGRKILLAREKVLEILQSENTCTEWYRSKDPDPVATFRTLTFSLDRRGEIYIQKTNLSDGMELTRSPYVASVMQGEGPHATVSINANGGFFLPMASVIQDRHEGGAFDFQGTRLLRVGPYGGGSFRAQVVTLLHEFGHVLDLLPSDHDDEEGKSRQNTLEVLRFCQAEVESKERRNTFLAVR